MVRPGRQSSSPKGSRYVLHVLTPLVTGLPRTPPAFFLPAHPSTIIKTLCTPNSDFRHLRRGVNSPTSSLASNPPSPLIGVNPGLCWRREGGGGGSLREGVPSGPLPQRNVPWAQKTANLLDNDRISLYGISQTETNPLHQSGHINGPLTCPMHKLFGGVMPCVSMHCTHPGGGLLADLQPSSHHLSGLPTSPPEQTFYR